MSAVVFFLCITATFAQECKMFENFENINPAAAYAGKIVTTPNGNWMILGYSQMDTNDRFLDSKSIRLRANDNDPASGAMTIPGTNTTGANVIQMQFDKQNGAGNVSFYYGSYSSHSGGIVSVEYSTDGGTSWIKPENNAVTSPAWNAGTGMQQFTVSVNVQGNVRIRIIKYKQLGTKNSVNVDNLCVTDFDPAGYVAAPAFNPPGGSYTAPVNVTITSATNNAIIRYTLDGSAPNEESPVFSTPISISEQTTLKAKAWKGEMNPSVVSTANYIFPTGVGTLAQLRALAPALGEPAGTKVFLYTGKAIVTHKQNNNNVKFIQDETAAIMIFDPGAGLLQKDIEVGDQITNISGTLTNYFGMLEIIPTGKCDVDGYFKKVSPVIVSSSQMDNNHENPIQSKVIKIINVLFTQTGNFETAKYYNLKENSITYDSLVYTDKWEADYIGKPIPTIAVNVLGVCNYRYGKNRIVMLDNTDAVLNISTINPSLIQLSPNPANSFVDIITGTIMKLEVYSIIGNRIATENLYEGRNTISVSQYPAGVYLLKMTDENSGESFVQKLVVR